MTVLPEPEEEYEYEQQPQSSAGCLTNKKLRHESGKHHNPKELSWFDTKITSSWILDEYMEKESNML